MTAEHVVAANAKALLNLAARLERIKRDSIKVNANGCWIWQGAIDHTGYGRARSAQDWRKTTAAHRLVYELSVGPIPGGLDLDHLCRVRSCVNPEHLEPVTRRVNLLRGQTLPAANVAKASCPAGHPYEGDNLRTSEGTRRCRQCVRERARAKRAATPRKGRQSPAPNQNVAKTHCPKGHPFSGENLAVQTHNGVTRRLCRECRRERDRRYWARKAAS